VSREIPAAATLADRPEAYRRRILALFADLERLATNPASADPEIRLQIEELRARLVELESQASGHEERSSSPAGTDSASPDADTPGPRALPPFYEDDRVAYAYSEGRLEQVRNESLPADHPAIAVPLIARGQAIGAVRLTSPSDRPFTMDENGIVHAVAQQASLQIESLRLLAEADQARVAAEAATRRFIHESWDSYLDAIHQQEKIGYAYDQASIIPFIEKPASEEVVLEAVKVLDEQVGALYLKPDPAHPLTESDRAMIAAVAGHIAQQVENIRLLADASRARAEADEIVGRTTREGWESYTAQKGGGGSLCFAYDSNQVLSYQNELPDQAALQLPLRVRSEVIGQLAVTGAKAVTPEAAEMAAAIAAQASLHLETLRLNEELQRRAAELMELDRLKTGFLANMSHELRTPLNSILGFADVMLEALDGPLTPNMSADLQLIQKNGQHLLHLINDVLDMAKIEAGRMNLDPEKFRVQEILEEVASITSTLASEKHLALFIEADSDQAVEIVADRTRMRQVMINLVNNAIKFTEKGQIAMRVVRKGETHIRITVEDTGIGIPPDKLEVIFQEFTQVDTSSTRKAGGTGLGLPISRRLVEMHGGSLWAESTGVAGEGSRFIAELPLVARITDVIEKKEK
jgi:signal transduction histidine kinase